METFTSLCLEHYLATHNYAKHSGPVFGIHYSLCYTTTTFGKWLCRSPHEQKSSCLWLRLPVPRDLAPLNPNDNSYSHTSIIRLTRLTRVRHGNDCSCTHVVILVRRDTTSFGTATSYGAQCPLPQFRVQSVTHQHLFLHYSAQGSNPVLPSENLTITAGVVFKTVKFSSRE
jgi:hypothetical protein